MSDPLLDQLEAFFATPAGQLAAAKAAAHEIFDIVGLPVPPLEPADLRETINREWPW